MLIPKSIKAGNYFKLKSAEKWGEEGSGKKIPRNL